MDTEGKRSMQALVIFIAILVLSGIIFGACPRMTQNRKAMNSESAKAMADKISKAKPGAILITNDGDLLRVENADGDPDHGNIITYTVNGTRDLVAFKHIAYKIRSVINQDDPDREFYKELVFAYMRGERFNTHPPPPR